MRGTKLCWHFRRKSVLSRHFSKWLLRTRQRHFFSVFVRFIKKQRNSTSLRHYVGKWSQLCKILSKRKTLICRRIFKFWYGIMAKSSRAREAAFFTAKKLDRRLGRTALSQWVSSIQNTVTENIFMRVASMSQRSLCMSAFQAYRNAVEHQKRHVPLLIAEMKLGREQLRLSSVFQSWHLQAQCASATLSQHFYRQFRRAQTNCLLRWRWAAHEAAATRSSCFNSLILQFIFHRFIRWRKLARHAKSRRERDAQAGALLRQKELAIKHNHLIAWGLYLDTDFRARKSAALQRRSFLARFFNYWGLFILERRRSLALSSRASSFKQKSSRLCFLKWSRCARLKTMRARRLRAGIAQRCRRTVRRVFKCLAIASRAARVVNLLLTRSMLRTNAIALDAAFRYWVRVTGRYRAARSKALTHQAVHQVCLLRRSFSALVALRLRCHAVVRAVVHFCSRRNHGLLRAAWGHFVSATICRRVGHLRLSTYRKRCRQKFLRRALLLWRNVASAAAAALAVKFSLSRHPPPLVLVASRPLPSPVLRVVANSKRLVLATSSALKALRRHSKLSKGVRVLSHLATVALIAPCVARWRVQVTRCVLIRRLLRNLSLQVLRTHFLSWRSVAAAAAMDVRSFACARRRCSSRFFKYWRERLRRSRRVGLVVSMVAAKHGGGS